MLPWANGGPPAIGAKTRSRLHDSFGPTSTVQPVTSIGSWSDAMTRKFTVLELVFVSTSRCGALRVNGCVRGNVKLVGDAVMGGAGWASTVRSASPIGDPYAATDTKARSTTALHATRAHLLIRVGPASPSPVTNQRRTVHNGGHALLPVTCLQAHRPRHLVTRGGHSRPSARTAKPSVLDRRIPMMS